ncbi:MAG: hypothetical protein RL323_1506 [Pseudomonadota bacterium]
MRNAACGCSSVDRVLASEAKGRGFDPRQPHQTQVRHPLRWRFCVRSRADQRLTLSVVAGSWTRRAPVKRLVQYAALKSSTRTALPALGAWMNLPSPM